MVEVWIGQKKLYRNEAVHLKGSRLLGFWQTIMSMQERRRRIDEIDGQIVMLLNRRAVEVKRVAQIKAAVGLPLVDEQRESEVYRRVAAENFGQIETESVLRIFNSIVTESRRLQVQALNGVADKGDPVR